MSDPAPYSVLGIALIVEERGKGARLVFRYPAVPEDQDVDNLFFTLPQRTMAKLFRPKRQLCNQPMTISLGGTVFCCRAVLMNTQQLCKEASSELVLFSVIVSLVPFIRSSALPIAGWFEGDDFTTNHSILTSPELDRGRSDRTFTNNQPPTVNERKVLPSFLVVRRIHLSLARVCRVLEREERRCRYVTIQSARLQEVAENFKASRSKNATTFSESTSEIGPLRHRRTVTAGTVGGSAIVTEMALDRDESNIEVRNRQERDQEVTDLMLAAKVEGTQIHGNLARELLQVFHAMSRTNEFSAPISSAIISARDCTVFINRHIAVPIDSIAQNLTEDNAHSVRPYHTLLFPKVAATQLADTFTSSNSRMKHFLSALESSKSLFEVAIDAALPLASVIDMATYLLLNSVCIVSHVISKDSILACFPDCIDRMNDLTLQFSQLFGHLSIHCVVSLLTMDCTLGELIGRLINGDSIDCGLLGDALESLIARVHCSSEEEKGPSRQNPTDQQEKLYEEAKSREMLISNSQLGGGLALGSNSDLQNENEAMHSYEAAVTDLEVFVLKMAAWLAAHRIVIPKQEFLVAASLDLDVKFSKARANMHVESTSVSRLFEESLCEELVAEGCLNGKVSTVAMCWFLSVDERSIARMKSWGRKTRKISAVWRVPSAGDDEWGGDGMKT